MLTVPGGLSLALQKLTCMGLKQPWEVGSMLEPWGHPSPRTQPWGLDSLRTPPEGLGQLWAAPGRAAALQPDQQTQIRTFHHLPLNSPRGLEPFNHPKALTHTGTSWSLPTPPVWPHWLPRDTQTSHSIPSLWERYLPLLQPLGHSKPPANPHIPSGFRRI